MGAADTPVSNVEGADGCRSIVEFLDLRPLGDDRWDAPIPAYAERKTLFGGQVAAQALRAAALTVDPEQRPSSLQAAYLSAGAIDRPLTLTVERIRDGQSFTTRRVVATQDERTVLTLQATFHRTEEGPSRGAPMPDVPAPGALPETPAPAGGVPDVPMEIRTPDPQSVPATPGLALWARTLETWPDDPVLAACLLVYIADMRTGFASISGLDEWVGGMLSSLDHLVWFHHDVDPTSWLLVDMHPLANGDARGLVLGTIHDSEGRHAATFTQEVLNRRRR